MTNKNKDPNCPKCGGKPLSNYFESTYAYKKYMCSKCQKTYYIYNEKEYREKDYF